MIDLSILIFKEGVFCPSLTLNARLTQSVMLGYFFSVSLMFNNKAQFISLVLNRNLKSRYLLKANLIPNATLGTNV